MIQVAVDERYISAIAVTDVEALVQDALEKYVINHISTKISALAKQKKGFEQQFGMAFSAFSDAVATDEKFIQQLEQTHLTWEQDLLAWEFCVKGITDWKQKLEHILTI